MNCLVCGQRMNVSHCLDGLLRCDSCGFVSADTSLSTEEMEKLYGEKYFHGEEYSDYIADKRLHCRNFKQKIKKLEKVAGSLKNKNVFEIGCAYGFFLESVSPYCKKAEGIDISKEAVEYARKRGIHCVQGDYLKYPQEEESIDIICMWDTIEHLSNPQEFVEKAYNKLKKGGFLCITTCDIGSINARIRGKHWRQIHPPTHLSYFSLKNLTMLLRKQGFTIRKAYRTGNEISIKNIMYTILCIHKRFDKIYMFMEKHGMLKGSVYFNFLDYIYVIAQK